MRCNAPRYNAEYLLVRRLLCSNNRRPLTGVDTLSLFDAVSKHPESLIMFIRWPDKRRGQPYCAAWSGANSMIMSDGDAGNVAFQNGSMRARASWILGKPFIIS